MKLTYTEYVELTVALEMEMKKEKEYIERWPDDCDFWKKRYETLNQILKKVEKARTKAYMTGLPA